MRGSTLIIGNGEGTIPPLSNYNHVIRLNHNGHLPCTLWVNNLRYFTPQPDTDKRILRLNYMRGGKEAMQYPKNWWKNTTGWNCEGYEAMRIALDLKKPSTGMMAVWYWLVLLQRTAHVCCFTHEGFDVHEWDKERDIFNDYIKMNRLRRV